MSPSDRKLTALFLCSLGIETSRIDDYMYMYQKVGFDLGYRFKITAFGVKSKNCQKYLEELLASGDITFYEDKLFCTSSGLKMYEDDVVLVSELEKLHGIHKELGKLNDSELNMLVIIDIVYTDVKNKFGTEGLVSKRQDIEKTVSNLCSTYSSSSFMTLFALLSDIERRYND